VIYIAVTVTTKMAFSLGYDSRNVEVFCRDLVDNYPLLRGKEVIILALPKQGDPFVIETRKL
jgi:hypothetical protein